MKGQQEVIDKLNELLADELTAINQYFLHAEMCGDWGYDKLHETLEARSIQEMKHAEKLIERILFLEGRPVVSELNKITIGENVLKQLQNDHEAENGAIKMYNDAVALTSQLGDNGSKILAESILTEEEEHIDWIEEQLDQIEQMGYERYLNKQA
ncbi:MAG: bacterioferritin [Brevefilum sp.]|nr:bacterioferritin [Brevefilum sp.]MDT8380987.1 bacterioferritin [Brevefilum sp.]MDW7753602.1 bacterioferritin [Brevefilum sp.]